MSATEDFGLLDPGQPTEAATRAHQEALRAEFTPAERKRIRLLLGIGTNTSEKF